VTKTINLVKGVSETQYINIHTVWAVDFETPTCKKFYVFFCQCCPIKRKREKKVLLPAGVSKSAAHTIYDQYGSHLKWALHYRCFSCPLISVLVNL
jgi:hypothetical protein